MGELKSVPNGIYTDDYMRRPIIESRYEKIKHCIYNPEEKTYFTRTTKQWGITGLFYFVFFSCLALMFAVCMKGMLATLSDEQPRYILRDSLIGTNPGLSFRPSPSNDKAMISYNPTNLTQITYWVEELDKFLEDYRNSSNLSNGGRNQQVCSYQQKARDGMVCEADISRFGPCTSNNGYGFNHSSPCVFIKLNRLFGWIPELYNDPNDLPSEMPESLKKTIKSLENQPQLNTIWLSCNETNVKDGESIRKIEYFSMDRLTQGFPSYFYPYQNIPGYLSPLVAVQFVLPTHNKEIPIQCKAWAKNINHDRQFQIGVVNFKLFINV